MNFLYYNIFKMRLEDIGLVVAIFGMIFLIFFGVYHIVDRKVKKARDKKIREYINERSDEFKLNFIKTRPSNISFIDNPTNEMKQLSKIHCVKMGFRTDRRNVC